MKTIALLLASTATPALAQATPPATYTPDSIIVTGTRSGDTIDAAALGASATLIDSQAIEQRQVRIVSDVLRDVPGVAVSRTGGVGGLTQVRLRGTEANQVLVLIDGIEVSDPYSGEFDFGTLIADEGASLEVLRGQQSSLYGSDAIGGVITYRTPTGADLPGITIRGEGGSLGTGAAAARAAGVAAGLDYALTGSFYGTNGQPVAIGGNRDVGSSSAAAAAKLGWTAGNLKLSAVGRYTRTRADQTDAPFGLPLDSPGVHSRNRGLFGLVGAEYAALGGRWTTSLSGQVADTRRRGYDVADPYAPLDGQPVTLASGDHGRRFKGSLASSIRFGEGDVRQRLTAAVDVERESERNTSPAFGAFIGWRHTTNVGVVGEYELTYADRVGVGASIRHDENDRFADPTTGRIEASVRAFGQTRLHAAYGSAVKDPSFAELFDYYAGRYVGNANLKPERSRGWEAGVRQGLLDGRVTLDATWFHNRLTDEITTTYDANFVGRPVNIPGRTKQEGLELSAAARLGDGVRLDAAWTDLHAPQDQSISTDPATGATGTFSGQAVRRAKGIGSVALSYAPDAAPYSATLTVRRTGAQNDLFFASYPPTLVRLRPITLVGLDGAWKLTRSLELFGRVENLFDQDRPEVYGFAGNGRAAYGGVRLRL